MVDAGQVVVVDFRILACQRWWCLRDPSAPACAVANLARCERTVWKPPQKDEAKDHANEAVDQEHPLEAHKAPCAVHDLESSRNETHDRCRDLRSGKVPPNPFASARRWVEQADVEEGKAGRDLGGA